MIHEIPLAYSQSSANIVLQDLANHLSDAAGELHKAAVDGQCSDPVAAELVAKQLEIIAIQMTNRLERRAATERFV